MFRCDLLKCSFCRFLIKVTYLKKLSFHNYLINLFHIFYICLEVYYADTLLFSFSIIGHVFIFQVHIL